MYSEWRQALCSAGAGICKEKKLAILFTAWCVICVFAGTCNFSIAYANYGIEISSADLLILQQHPWHTGIMIVPAAVFLMMRCKRECRNMQFLLRYGSRRKALLLQFIESTFYAIGISTLLLGVEIVIGFGKNVPVINWQEEGSLFWTHTGKVTEASIFTVIILLLAMYIVKFMLILCLLDIAMWCPNVLFLLWVFLVVIAGMEQLGTDLFYRIFAVQYSLWLIPGGHVAVILAGMLLLILECAAGCFLVKRKDMFM